MAWRLGACAAAVLGILLLSADCGDRGVESAPPTGPSGAAARAVDGCTAAAVGEPGHRLFALLVGVGKYRDPSIATLRGPSADVADMRSLLVERYGYPPENICTLLDSAATVTGFRNAFDRTLVQRAAANDVVVVYFSGHGSQTPDTNGDDSGDGWDETLVLHDSQMCSNQLVDDDFNTMLERLHERTHNIVVILDSCNSGSATRDVGDTSVRVKVHPPCGKPAPVISGSMGGASDPWIPTSLPGAVVLTAASDGTSALEINDRGVFTQALVQVLEQPGRAPLTYAQLARLVPPVVSASRSSQVPYFQGDLDREVFGATARPRPLAWEVKQVGPVVEIAGPPMPGLDRGAELRVHAPSPNFADYGDPAKAKATIVVDQSTGLTAKAHVSAAASGSPPLAAGDFAILVRPADDALQLTVSLLPEGKPGGIPQSVAADLKRRIADDPDAQAIVRMTDTAGLFELSRTPEGLIVVRDKENAVRNVLKVEQVAETLASHARQNALRHLHGENGSDFTDEETLKVELVPAAKQKPCGATRLADWVQSPPNQHQIMPLCVAWNVKVTLADDAPVGLLVGGVVLSTDGAAFGFPNDDSEVKIEPGRSHTFTATLDTYRAQPPLGTRDMVRVFGTQEGNPVPWNRVTQSVRTRSVAAKGGSASPLFRALDRYLVPGARGVGHQTGAVEDTTWTVSTVTMAVEANPRFAQPDAARAGAPNPKEYTLPNFDVRPYMPDDEHTALYAVLKQAEALAHRQVGYKQHEWSGASDDENLAAGIDCSRAIWFAFTRASLPYNSGNVYLSTADMVGAQSRMKEQFERIDLTSERRLGDILVYRDDQRGDGHVVMVIDPRLRIAWGSHGWDGTARELPVEPRTGVEYQLIKYKPDWDRWDRKTMELKAIWRYREFSREADAGRGVTGLHMLANPCDDTQCRSTPPPVGAIAVPGPGPRQGRAR